MSITQVTATSEEDLLVPQHIEDVAKRNPEQHWVTAPCSPDLHHGWKQITFGELNNAMNGMTHWLDENACASGSQEVITYMGVQDERYAVVFAAVMKAGHKVMLASVRNSLEGALALFERTKCRTILYSEGIESTIVPIRNANSALRILKIPTFDELVQIGKTTKPIPAKTNTKRGDKNLVLHTSGSTGLPKPIFIANATLAMLSKIAIVTYPNGRENYWSTFMAQKPMFSMLPYFHSFGVVTMLRSLLSEAPLVLPPTGRPLNSDVILKVLQQTKPWALLLAPSIIEELSNSKDGLNALAESDFLFFGGAPLSHEAGDKVNQVVPVMSVLGSTEAWANPMLRRQDRNDWSYFEFGPDSGVVFEPQSDSTYEMVIKRQDDTKHQAVFQNFPELDEWRTKDLFIQHPSKPELFQFLGRKDDVIVLNNGEKFQPVDFEKSMESHPLINGALAVGEGRFQAGLLIEPRWNKLSEDDDSNRIVDLIWPSVEHANEAMPNHGKIWRSKIAITKRDKPFRRAPKGSIMRRATNVLYKDEIEALYSNEGYGKALGTLNNLSSTNQVKDFIRKACKLVFTNFVDDISDDTDFFSLGTDSLQVLGLANALGHAMKMEASSAFSPREIYNHPTVDSLTKYIVSRHGGTASNASSREDEIGKMLDKFTTDLSDDTSSKSIIYGDQRVVLLTGSTGSLGGYMLENLIASKHVSKVYALNRSTDAKQRQQDMFKTRGVSIDTSKVTFLQASFGEKDFALAHDIYQELLSSVDLIIHAAWAVDFNKSLQSYEEVHVRGVRRFIDFSIASKHRAHVVFISSIAAGGNWGQSHPEDKLVPETILEDNSAPIPQGYGESKYVAERILGAGAKKSRVPVTIVRAGQLAGAATGNSIWNKHEWIPSIVATSKAMGIIPSSLGNQEVIDWVPMDIAAQVVLELSELRQADIETTNDLLAVYNMVNPERSTWNDLLPTLKEGLGHPRTVSYVDWVNELKKVPLTAEEAADKPGIKLVEYYEDLDSAKPGLMKMSTEKSAQKSKILGGLGRINAQLMDKWIGQWDF